MADGGRLLRLLAVQVYHNTWLYFKCSGDASELFEHNLPQPHHYERFSEASYAIGWLIDGFFHTTKGIAYLNDIIARIALTVPIRARYDYAPANCKDYKPLHLASFQNAINLRTKYIEQRIKHSNDASKDMVWWAIKYQAESYIRQFKGWFDCDLLETWAFSNFEVGLNVKDRSTLRAKCRSTWRWYEERDFSIPKNQRRSSMSREDNIKRVNEQRKLDAKQKVLEASRGLTVRKKNGKINVSAVSEQAGVRRETAKKYLKELGLI